MSVLAKNQILEEIKSGRIKIEPFDQRAIGPGSIDLTLANIFRVFKKQNEVFQVQDNVNYEKITELVTIENKKFLFLKPGETLLGITKEKITLSQDICGWIEGRSRFARIGIGVHVTAGFIQPGVSNYQVLEISNLSPNTLSLKPGLKICQIILEYCEGKAKYLGQFKDQKTP